MERIALAVIFYPVVVVINTTITSAFVYFGWNGCHELLGVREIFFREAFWFAMLARSVLTVNPNTLETSKK